MRSGMRQRTLLNESLYDLVAPMLEQVKSLSLLLYQDFGLYKAKGMEVPSFLQSIFSIWLHLFDHNAVWSFLN